MKHRSAPSKPDFKTSHAALLRQPNVKRWISKLRADPSLTPTDLNAEQLAAVYRELRGATETSAYAKAYKRTVQDLTPVLSAPEVGDPHEAMRLVFGLPEMQRFWASWEPPLASSIPGQSRRGPHPDFSTAKAVMCVLAMAGESAFLEDAYNSLNRNQDLRVTFETLARMATDRSTPFLPGLGGRPEPLDLMSYATVSRHLPRIAEECIRVARSTRIELINSLRPHFPDIGLRLNVDGCPVPAWARQRGSRKDDTAGEEKLRKHCPEAGFRIYVHTSSGKRSVKKSDSAQVVLMANISKSWRGYYKVTLVDCASGLPLVTLVFDASHDEAHSLPELLKMLFDEWRHLDPEFQPIDIAGDSGFDEDWACETCLMNYGIHPIFRLHDPKPKLITDKHSRDGVISAITAEGQLVCSVHNNRLTHLGLEGIDRTGLEPGDRQPGGLRVRAQCPDGCGRTGLTVAADYSKLQHYPHFNDNGPRQHLHAYRDARLNTLNIIESYHNRLKSGFKLGTQGPDRTRLRDLSVVTALMELADLFMVAATVWDVRDQFGIPMSVTHSPTTITTSQEISLAS